MSDSLYTYFIQQSDNIMAYIDRAILRTAFQNIYFFLKSMNFDFLNLTVKNYF